MESTFDENQARLRTAKSQARSLHTSRTRTCSELPTSYMLRSQTTTASTQRRTKSCRSELDMSLMNEQNREKLIEAFLPDIRRIHARMGYSHRVRPFNLNQEKLKTVQIRAKTSWLRSELREHSDHTLGSGAKAANSTTPRPAWDVKELPINSVNDRLFPGDTPVLTAYVKRQDWNYKDLRSSLDRPLPKTTRDK